MEQLDCLYAWGSNSEGQLGVDPHSEEDILSPKMVATFPAHSIAQISGGATHTLLLTSDDRVLSCGSNKFGQLGHSTHANTLSTEAFRFCAVQFMSGDSCNDNICESECNTRPAMQIKRVCAGWDFSLALSESDAQLYAWGRNQFGQLGTRHTQHAQNAQLTHKQTHAETESFTQIPQKLQFPGEATRIAQMAAGIWHCIALSEDRRIFVWGRNNFGQLSRCIGGGAASVECCCSIEVGPLELRIEDLRVSALSQSVEPANTTAITAAGDSLVIGGCAAGAYHSLIWLTSTNEVIVWGDNRFGQCSEVTEDDAISLQNRKQQRHGVVKLVRPISARDGQSNTHVERISEVICGWAHNLVLTNHRRLFGWGRDQMGQLGAIKQQLQFDWVSSGSDHCLAVISERPPANHQQQSQSQPINSGQLLVAWGWNEHGMCAQDAHAHTHFRETQRVPLETNDSELVLIGCGYGNSLVVMRRNARDLSR